MAAGGRRRCAWGRGASHLKVVRWGLPQFSIRGPTGPRAACGVSKYSVALHQPRWLANSSPARYARPASALSQPSHSHARVDRVDDQLRAMRAAEHVFDRGGFAAAMYSVALRAKSKRECAVCELERGKEEVYSARGASGHGDAKRECSCERYSQPHASVGRPSESCRCLCAGSGSRARLHLCWLPQALRS